MHQVVFVVFRRRRAHSQTEDVPVVHRVLPMARFLHNTLSCTVVEHAVGVIGVVVPYGIDQQGTVQAQPSVHCFVFAQSVNGIQKRQLPNPLQPQVLVVCGEAECFCMGNRCVFFFVKLLS